MISTLLKKAFDPYHPLPISDWEAIAALGETVTVDSETLLKKHDSNEKYLNFILQGSAGVLLWNKNNFVCTDIFFENDFVCDFLSVVTKLPSPYESITFEKTKLLRIPLTRFEQYIDQHREGDKIWRQAMTALYVEKHYQQLQLLTHTASERYKLMLQHQGFVLQRIPLKYIASYLGVTPQSLSRIRTEVSE